MTNPRGGEMPYLNVIYMNHLDLTWRRPRYSSDHKNPYVVAPYAEVQERQLDRALEYMRDGGVYTLEQTVSLREYLDRNPDAETEIRQMFSDGRLRIVGGGESIVDTNLPDGESLIRNHVYSRLWLRNEFGYTPKLAAVPDSFGLSAGLPGLFRQLGYRGLLQYSRVFQNAKPYWRGVSGDIVALATASRVSNSYGWWGTNFRKSRVCTVCGGQGCAACHMRGVEVLNVPKDEEDILALEEQVKTMAQKGDVTIQFDGEETRAPENAAAALRTLADRCGMTLRFVCPEDDAIERFSSVLSGVDSPDEDEIDPRLEGNPVAAGCYTTRIRLKQENRRCESALRNAERLAALASLRGMPYPAKMLEKCWRKLAFVGFHDALPASHSDGAYHELTEVCRSIRTAAFRVTERSAKKLLEGIRVKEEDEQAFAVLNPLEFDVHHAVLKAGIRLPKDYSSCRIVDPDGKECAVLSVVKDKAADIDAAEVTFIGSVPAMGYSVFHALPEEPASSTETFMPHGCVIENEYLRVEFSPYSVKSVFDKMTQRVIAGEGTFSPILSDDAGHPWGRTNPVQYKDRADLDTFWENMFPASEFSRSLTLEHRPGVDIARLRVLFSRPERGTNRLKWTAEFLLPRESRELQVQITTSFDAHDLKLSTSVNLPAVPDGERLDYEIPLGRISRGPVQEFNPQLGYADEWPALRYVTARMNGYAVTLCNQGTAGHLLEENQIRVSLMRTPTQLGCGWGIDEAIDTTPHEFRFTLAAEKEPDEIEAYRRGMILNTEFPSILIKGSSERSDQHSPHSGQFLRLPNNLPMLALKGSEDGRRLIVRYLGGSAESTLTFEQEVFPCNLLEDEIGDPCKEVFVGKYKIITLQM